VFDIPLLGRRLAAATGWLRHQPETGELPLGYFGASTGAAATHRRRRPRSPGFGGRLTRRATRPRRPQTRRGPTPTLLIVGGLDTEVLELNRQTQRQLRCTNDLQVVAGDCEPLLALAVRLVPGWWQAASSRAAIQSASTPSAT
jgi:putative phosphoribosyl transferase